MKIYVAGKFENKGKVLKVYEKLKEIGHSISYDWTAHKPIKPFEENQGLSKEYSYNDILGVANCDVFILISNEKEGTGKYIELGAAILSNIKFGKPIIYVVGIYNKSSMFYFHPSVKIRSSVEEVISEIEKNKEQI